MCQEPMVLHYSCQWGWQIAIQETTNEVLRKQWHEVALELYWLLRIIEKRTTNSDSNKQYKEINKKIRKNIGLMKVKDKCVDQNEVQRSEHRAIKSSYFIINYALDMTDLTGSASEIVTHVLLALPMLMSHCFNISSWVRGPMAVNPWILMADGCPQCTPGISSVDSGNLWGLIHLFLHRNSFRFIPTNQP